MSGWWANTSDYDILSNFKTLVWLPLHITQQCKPNSSSYTHSYCYITPFPVIATNDYIWIKHTSALFYVQIFSVVDEYAPGFSDTIVGYEVLPPPDLERIFGLTGGVSGRHSAARVYCYSPSHLLAWNLSLSLNTLGGMKLTPVKYLCHKVQVKINLRSW